MRGMNWKAKQLLDYAIELAVDSVLLNGLDYFESLDEKYLKTLKDLMDQAQHEFIFWGGRVEYQFAILFG